MKLHFSEHIRSIPVLRVLPWLCTGIYAGYRADNPGGFLPLVFCLIIFFLLCAIFYLRFAGRLRHTWIRGSVTAIFFILAGFNLILPSKEIPFLPENRFWIGEICNYPEEKEKTCLLKIRLLSALSPEQFPGRKNYILAYIRKDDLCNELKPGDRIFFRARLSLIRNRGNPGEFNYAGWLRKKRIFYRCFVHSKADWTSWTCDHGGLRFRPLHIRESFIQIIQSRDAGEKEKAVLSAICLGARDRLDPEIKKAFANAGAIHVMAVSGLHVGMIWMFLSFFLGFVGETGYAPYFRIFTGILVLWFYAVMTGMSPSVTRSCLMFSLIGSGKVLRRETGSLNTLFIAAFIQLLIKPVLLLEAGFQFSYLAVLSILLFYKRISLLLEIKIPVMNWASRLIAVSLSAQILTFPLTIIYFHQFPVWFLLSNLVVIPLVTLIMIFFLMACIFFPLSDLRNFFLDLSLKLTQWLNGSVGLIDSLPSPTIENLSMTHLQLVICLLIPLLMLYFVEYRKIFTLLMIQFLFLIFILSGMIDRLRCLNNSELIAYNLIRGTAVGVKYPGQHIIFMMNGNNSTAGEVRRASSAYWAKQYYPEPEFVDLRDIHMTSAAGAVEISLLPGEGNYVLQYGKFRATLLSQPFVEKVTTKKVLRTDLLVICSDDRKGVLNLMPNFRFKWLLFSSGMKGMHLPALGDEVKVWDMDNSGAFMLKIDGKRKKNSMLRQLAR